MRIKPFQAQRPSAESAPRVASVPYDVVNRQEAAQLAEGVPESFLHVIRPEIDLPEDLSPYDDQVYLKARENLDQLIAGGFLTRDEQPALYLYRQEMNGHVQTGLVACCHADDYHNDLILKHERTLQKKEDDRTRHVDTLNANTGPVFLSYPDDAAISEQTRHVTKNTDPVLDFTAPDNVRHSVWLCPDTEDWIRAFEGVSRFYVADGHHRSASAARVARMRQEANPDHTGEEEYNWFMCVLFPAGSLRILAYNRVVRDVNGLTPEAFLSRIQSAGFEVEKSGATQPDSNRSCCMFLDGEWMKLNWQVDTEDPVECLDVSVVQNRILAPILGIEDPRTDSRIDFVGGIRGPDALEQRVRSGEAAVAFSMFPTSMDELMAVASAGRIMPPKSTWFEPKLRSGLFVHQLD